MKKPKIQFNKSEPPEGFTDQQKKFFHYYRGRLEENKSLEKFDFEALVNISMMADLRERLNDDIRANGITFSSEGRNGKQMKLNPSVTQLNKTLNDLRQFYKDYGLTPRAHEVGETKDLANDNPFGKPMKIVTG